MDGFLAYHVVELESLQSRPRQRHGGQGDPRQAASRGGAQSNHRKDRRSSAVRRGVDEDGARVEAARRTRRRLCAHRAAAATGNSVDAQRFVDGAPRSAGTDQGRGADGCGDRAGVLIRAACGGFSPGRRRVAQSPGTADRGRADLSPRPNPAKLRFQARFGAGCGLRFDAAQASPAATRSHCKRHPGSISRPGPGATGSPGSPFCRRRGIRDGDRPLAAGRAPGHGTLREPRSGPSPEKRARGPARACAIGETRSTRAFPAGGADDADYGDIRICLTREQTRIRAGARAQRSPRCDRGSRHRAPRSVGETHGNPGPP